MRSLPASSRYVGSHSRREMLGRGKTRPMAAERGIRVLPANANCQLCEAWLLPSNLAGLLLRARRRGSRQPGDRHLWGVSPLCCDLSHSARLSTPASHVLSPVPVFSQPLHHAGPASPRLNWSFSPSACSLSRSLEVSKEVRLCIASLCV